MNPPAKKLIKSKSPAKIPAKFCADWITHSIGEPVLFNGAVAFKIKLEVSGVVGVTSGCWVIADRKAFPGKEPM